MIVRVTAYDRSWSENTKGERSSVGAGKDKAAAFANQFLKEKDCEDSWTDHPKGFAGVWKGNLPHYELIPAVRSVEDERKVGKTNPFGRLIHSIIARPDPELKKQIEEVLSATDQELAAAARTGPESYFYRLCKTAHTRSE